MHETQTITLSESVSSQPNGIVLHLQRYENSQVKGQNHTYFFIPKSHVKNWPGDGCDLFSIAGSTAFWKYMYIYDTEIKGHANNDRTDLSVAGITCENNKYVITEVIGV